MSFGSSGYSTQDCTDPCADPCAKSSYGGSGGSSQDQCVDPCAQTVPVPTDCAPCLEVDPCARTACPKPEMVVPSVPVSSPAPKSLDEIIGAHVSTRAGRMVGGKFVASVQTPTFKPAKREVAGVGASIGASSSARMTGRDLIKPAAGSPTDFAERLKARREARRAQFSATASCGCTATTLCNTCGGSKKKKKKQQKPPVAQTKIVDDDGFDSGSDSDSVGF